jgi:hypothetical protein
MASAHAVRGDDHITVVLCKSSDSSTPPDMSHLRQMLTDHNVDGLAGYWWDMSSGTFDMAGTDVKGWYTVPETTADWMKGQTGPKIDACLAAAAADTTQPYTPPAGNRIVVMSFPWIGVQDVGDRALVSADTDVGTVSHEAGHTLGLGHSWSNDVEYVNIWWAGRAEYDNPWDSMSWQNAWHVPTSAYGDGSAWMTGPMLDTLGWLPRSRIKTVGADGMRRGVYRLAALSHPEAAGYLMLRVPMDVADPNHYLTIEFRRKDSWDAEIPADTVLIQELRNGVPRVQRDRTTTDRDPLAFYMADGVMVRVNNVDTTNNISDVTVVTDYPVRCLRGYVWREITSQDLVCVTAADRAQILKENGEDSSHKQPGGGLYGDDTCKQSYVWRDAILKDKWPEYPGDHICVDGAARQREAENNAMSASRTNPTRLTFGPNACKAGFVWREADDWDWVCVTAATRALTRQENADAPVHRSPTGGPYGPDTCLQGYVWRDAFPGDHVCVLPTRRSAARDDNNNRASRWLM